MPTVGSHRRSLTAHDDRIVQAVAIAAAIAASFAPAQPTGTAVADVAWKAALALLVVFATARAHRWSWLVLGGVAAGTSVGVDMALGWSSLVVGLAGGARALRLRVLGAVVGALAANALLRQDWYLFHGASTLVGAAAIAPVLVSGYRRSRSRQRRLVRRVAVTTGAVVGLATITYLVAFALAAGSLSHASDEAHLALRAASAGRADAAEVHLGTAAANIRAGRSTTSAMWAQPVRLVPGLAQHARAIDVASDRALHVAVAAALTAHVGDYQSLKYASGRVDLDRVTALHRPLTNTASTLDEAGDGVDGIDRSWLLPPLRERVDSLATELREAGRQAADAAKVVDALPGLLGGDGERTYLVVFENPAEQRGLGGLFGNYAELRAADGKVRLARSGATTSLERATDPALRHLDGPAEYLKRYGDYQPAHYLRDATLSPNFPDVAEVLDQLYPQVGGDRLDGVIAMDPTTLARLLRFTGPVRVHGVRLTYKNAADYVLRKQYLTFGDSNDERKDILVDATKVVFDRLLGGDLPSPARLVRALGPMVAERRLMFNATRAPEQRVFRRLGADGALPRAADDQDTFSLVHQNFGNDKLDTYLHRSVDYRTTVDARTGAVSATATVTLRNDVPPAPLPRYISGNTRGAAEGTNLMNLSVYSSLDLAGAELDGEPIALTAGVEAGSSTYSGLVSVARGQTRVLVVHLRGGADLGKGRYRVAIIPQPSVIPDQVTATIAAQHGTVEAVVGDEDAELVDGRASRAREDQVATLELEATIGR